MSPVRAVPEGPSPAIPPCPTPRAPRDSFGLVPPYANRSGIDIDPRGVPKWAISRAWARLPRPPEAPILPVTPDLPFLLANREQPSFTWIGHASFLLQLAGLNILVDPVFSRVVSPLPPFGPRRHQAPGLLPSQLPHIDVVCLSHDHYDHLDLPSVRAVERQTGGPPLFLVPAGVDAWFARALPSARTRAFAWEAFWRSPHGVEFHFHPVQHWSSRRPFRRNATLWGSWAILHEDFRFWYSGDLGYSDDPRRIGERFGHFDLAAIGIGAYEPRWFMRRQHVNPDEAVQVMLDVNAAMAVGVHWGTFPLSDEALDEPPRALASALAARDLPPERFITLRHGETWRVSRLVARGA